MVSAIITRRANLAFLFEQIAWWMIFLTIWETPQDDRKEAGIKPPWRNLF
jgi:hypothetical protein